MHIYPFCPHCGVKQDVDLDYNDYGEFFECVNCNELFQLVKQHCPHCDGTGSHDLDPERNRETCQGCGGSGDKREDEFKAEVKCAGCHNDCTKQHWMCDRDIDKVYCQACWVHHPCYLGHHGEGCATFVAELEEKKS